ncbi:MAG: AMP-binding protein [Actinomycetes bacterium]
MSNVGIVDRWRALWAAAPEAVVLVDQATGRDWRAGELESATAWGAAYLHSLGIRSGASVILSAAPSDATALAFIGLLRLGAVVVPVNTAATPREIAHISGVSGATHALSDEPERFTQMSSHSVTPLTIPGEAVDTSIELDRTVSTDRALICFTSGTTGAPKGAPLTHGNLLAGTTALVECWQWSADDVLVSALPMFHVHGLLVALAGTLTAGATIVVHHKFDANRLVDSALTHHATLVFGVPTMWARLADSGRLFELAHLRLAVSGSAPLAPTLFTTIHSATLSAPVERYGMTETMILTSTPVGGIRRAGTVGRPLPGMSIRIADDGVVEVRGESVFGGYLTSAPTDPLLRSGFTDDGWFRTGDIGEWDGDDLRLVGRASELIITGGYNVYPREVEDVLRTDVAIADAAVVGLADDTWGETVAAFVVLESEAVADAETLERWESLCSEQLAPYKRPRSFSVIDELPRNAMGKVKRDDLRARGVVRSES